MVMSTTARIPLDIQTIRIANSISGDSTIERLGAYRCMMASIFVVENGEHLHIW